MNIRLDGWLDILLLSKVRIIKRKTFQAQPSKHMKETLTFKRRSLILQPFFSSIKGCAKDFLIFFKMLLDIFGVFFFFANLPKFGKNAK